MFKLVVLCAFFAAAAAKPDLLIATPLTQYSTLVSPGSTTITKSASSVIHPSPLVYSAPLTYTHFIKKRSAQFPLSYIAPSTYVSTSNLGATAYSTPLVHSGSIVPAVSPLTYTHFIKKRSAQFPLSYIDPSTYVSTSHLGATAYSPLVHSASIVPAVSPLTYAHLIKKRSPQLLTNSFITPTAYTTSPVGWNGAPLISSPWVSSAWNTEPVSVAHLIKKRSAPLLTTYVAPTAVSHQARIDLQSTPLITSYSTPLAYSSPLISHIY